MMAPATSAIRVPPTSEGDSLRAVSTSGGLRQRRLPQRRRQLPDRAQPGSGGRRRRRDRRRCATSARCSTRPARRARPRSTDSRRVTFPVGSPSRSRASSPAWPTGRFFMQVPEAEHDAELGYTFSGIYTSSSRAATPTCSPSRRSATEVRGHGRRSRTSSGRPSSRRDGRRDPVLRQPAPYAGGRHARLGVDERRHAPTTTRACSSRCSRARSPARTRRRATTAIAIRRWSTSWMASSA